MSRNNILLIVLISIAVLAVFFLGKSCQPIPEQKGLDKDSLINVIAEKNKERKINITRAVHSDSARKVEVIKYRYIKTNPEKLPCDTVLKLIVSACDSVIVKDSTHIADLNKIIQVDSVIIGTQAKVITQDSTTIVGLRKGYKKLKRQRNIFAVIAALIAGVAVVK